MDISSDILHSFTLSCYEFIARVNNDFEKKTANFLRKHDSHHSKHGDFSFPLTSSANSTNADNSLKKQEMVKRLSAESTNWTLKIVDRCKMDPNIDRVIIFLDRKQTFQDVLALTLGRGNRYGQTLPNNKTVALSVAQMAPDCERDLSRLRLEIHFSATKRLLLLAGYTVTEGQMTCERLDETVGVYLFSEGSPSPGFPVKPSHQCGLVVDKATGRPTSLSADRYAAMRLADMRVLAEQKFGTEGHAPDDWEDMLGALRDAAVKVDLLSTKPSRKATLDLCPGLIRNRYTHSRGASFVMYNYARICEIQRQFALKVEAGIYPPLIPLSKIDFSLLNREEEWQLLVDFILPYPSVITDAVQDIGSTSARTDRVCSFLAAMCLCFSVYYRRVRVLTESRSQLLPEMYARLHLLEATRQVLHCALDALDIAPLKQM